MMRRLLWIAALGWELAGAAQTPPTGGAASPMPGVEGLLTTTAGLVFILVLIFGAAWLFKRVGHLPAGGKGPVRILGGVSLSPRERVVVVEVENARLVLGVAPGRVQTLHVLPPETGFQQTLENAQEHGG